jgi:hypothetical protein
MEAGRSGHITKQGSMALVGTWNSLCLGTKWAFDRIWLDGQGPYTRMAIHSNCKFFMIITTSGL